MNRKLFKLGALVVSLITMMGLAGCDDSPSSAPSYYDPAADQKFRFERMRENSRKWLSDQAAQDPEKLGYVVLSLWDYFPITTLEEFENKYPNLKVIWTDVMVKGTNWPTEINPDLPLKQELDQVIKLQSLSYEKDLEKAKQEAPPSYTSEEIKKDIAGAQSAFDAIKAGNVRTFGFAVQGKLKDIEAMAEQEYGERGKLIRVIMMIGRISTGELPYSDYEPIYANDDKTVDRYK